jgi:hypothetical protein
MSYTPILDKYGLHHAGGYCTCFTNPYSRCTSCDAVRESARRWENLSPKIRKKAEKEMEQFQTSNQDGR